MNLSEGSAIQELSSYFMVNLLGAFIVTLVRELFSGFLWVAQLIQFFLGLAFSLFRMVKSKEKLIFSVMSFGGILNLIALAANGFRMPVFGPIDKEFLIGIHKKGNRTSKLKILCDIYEGDMGIYSIGDVIIWIAAVTLLVKGFTELMIRLSRPIGRMEQYVTEFPSIHRASGNSSVG